MMYSSTSLVGASPASSASSMSSYTSSSFSSSSSSSSSSTSALRRSPSSTASSSASSSLFNFSSYPSYVPPSTSLASELEGGVYRGLDPTSSIFALPPPHQSSLSASTAALSLDDFDSLPADAHSSHFTGESNQSHKKLDIPSFATLTDLSVSDFPSAVSPVGSSAAPSLPSPVCVSSEPSYLERYTSFYSSTPADQLLTALTTLLTTHRIDHTLSRSKAKLVVSFQCELLSSLTVSFILRLYQSAARPNTLIVEGQRREGCVVAFHHVWGRLVKECKLNGLCTGLVEEGSSGAQLDDNDSSDNETSVPAGLLGMCSLLGDKAASASSAHPLSPVSPSPVTPAISGTQPLPSFQLDASASAILSNLVDNGDILQQRDALRLLSLSLLSSPSASTQCQSFLSRIARWASPAAASSSASSSPSTSSVAVSNDSQPLDDERTAQLARLMLICTQIGSPDAFVRQCAHSLFELLDELVQQPPSAMSMCRLRGLRCLLQVVGQLCRAEGGRVLVPYVGSHERAVLERCAGMTDEAVQQESRAVLQRLGRAH